ncbi:MAG: RnfH family protein [Gammaproteobacteria bacterium AqS3]|nr:RnfH family protein [Gammaproteobacteria bacterium AqS3]
MAETPSEERITVEVAYALPELQRLLRLEVARGTTALEAVRLSGIAELHPEIDIEQMPMGIFSRPLNGKQLSLPGDYVLQPGERVELYRPLLLSPQEARLLRAERARAKRAGKSPQD